MRDSRAAGVSTAVSVERFRTFFVNHVGPGRITNCRREHYRKGADR
jgi:hypothetical protein